MSEDRLRAILAEFKLDLIERLTRELSHKADLAHVSAVEKRVEMIELRLDAQDGWRNRINGAVAILSVFVFVGIPASVGLVVHFAG